MLPWIEYSTDYSASNTDFYAWCGPGMLCSIEYANDNNISISI